MIAFRGSLSAALGLLAMAACDPSASRVDPDSGGEGDLDAGTGEHPPGEHPPDAASQRPCEQRGPIGLPWAEGVFPVRSYGDAGPYLHAFPDAVTGTTHDGAQVPCSLFMAGAYYACESEHGLKSISVSLAGQRWSWPAQCPFWEDYVRLNLTDLVPCLEPGTIVVEGDLLGFDAARSDPVVTLEGPWQEFENSADFHTLARDERSAGHIPGIACTVREGHFTCPTLGFRATVTHAVIAGGRRTEVPLPVSDCAASRVSVDITCAASPPGFYVEVPSPRSFPNPLFPASREPWPSFTVEASYEGGEAYPCEYEPDAIYAQAANATFLCPPAAGDAWGRGRYEVVASSVSNSGRPLYTGSIADPFDGCGGWPEPLRLQSAPR